MREISRRITLMVAAVAAFVVLAAPSAAQAANCSSCVWGGGGVATSTSWSNGANWQGGNPPSSSVTSLGFPAITCATGPGPDPCSSHNNVSGGVAAGSMSIDDTTGYNISGNAVTLGAGGVQASASNCDSFGGGSPTPFLQIPIALSATQSWTIGGCSLQSGGFGSLALFGTITGSVPLTVNMSDAAGLSLARMNVGDLSFVGNSGGAANEFVDVQSFGPFGSPSLNGTSGNPVSFSGGANLGVFGNGPGGSATTGPLSMSGGLIFLGAEQAVTLTVNGAFTMDSTSELVTSIAGGGSPPVAGTDYSQLAPTGNTTVAGFLSIDDQDPTSMTGACRVLHAGDVYTLVSTGGALSGTFSNAPNNATIQPSCFGGTPPTLRINYTADAVTATVLDGGSTSVTTTTMLSGNPSSPVTNQGTTLTANVTAGDGTTPTGTVSFSDGVNQISGCGAQPVDPSGNATCQTSFSAGTHSLSATYSPSPSSQYSGSVGADSMTVGKDSTSTALSASTTSPAVGQSVTYTATVAPAHSGSSTPSGSVQFSDGGSPISGCSSQALSPAGSSSTATCTTSYSSAGSHNITASYGGDGNFTGSASAAQSVTAQQPSSSPPPTVSATSQPADGVTSTGATLHGQVNTAASAVTWQFQYGESTNYNKATPIQTITAGHSSSVAVSWTLTSLQPLTTYHFRLVVITQSGSGQTPVSTDGSDLTFTTNATGKLRLRFSTLTMSGGSVSLPLSCQSALKCSGRVLITTKARVGKSAKTARVVCSTTSFTVKAHKKKSIKTKISGACMSLLRHAPGHRIKAQFTAILKTGQFAAIKGVSLVL